MAMTLIDDSSALADFCARQAESPYIAIDTEFIRDTTYWPKLCLVQIGGPEEAVAIDSLAEGLDLEPLLELLANERVLKVFHSARQDMEIFFHLTGRLPAPIFDTQVAAMVCGFNDSVAYDTLAKRLLGVRIDKGSRFADWALRPLAQRQIDYALADVIHLRPIYERLAKQLRRNGREAWLSEEMAVLTSPETYRLDPEEAWRRLKARSTNRGFLAVLLSLAAWREREAQSRDVPRNRVVRDEQLLDIAAHLPETPEALARTRGLSPQFAGGKMGKAILAAVAEGRAVPAKERPRPLERPERQSELAPLVELLKVMLKHKCQKNGVAQKLVASSADLELIAQDDEAPVPALQGWRREVFGADALALKHGEIALTAAGGEVALIEMARRSGPEAAADG
jgi:ribonuclease D